MSYCCELTQKTSQNGNNVSHSCKKTKCLFRPNLQKVGFFSEILSKKISFKVAASVVKTVNQCGGLDEFLLKQKNNKLSSNALKIKQLIIKHLAEVQKKQISQE